LALALAEQAISQWLLDDHPGQALRLSLIGTEAPTLRDTLLMRHPVLAPGGAAAVPELAPMLPLAELVACRADETELGPADWRSLQADVPFDAVYVVPETDLRAGRAAARMLALREAFGARAGLVVVTAFTDPADAAHPLPFEHRDHHWFRVHDRCLLRDEPYPGATADLRAALVDHAYRQASSGRAAPAVAEGGAAVSLSAVDLPAAIEAWLGTDEAFRWSSRCAGDHYPVKLACLEAFAGERLRGDALRAAIARHRDWLTRLEHRRFVVERLFDGWLPRPPDTPTEVAKAKRLLRLNDTLKPFELLDAGIADIDTRIVDAMADILALQEAGVGFPAAGGARR
jgi:hypothetical protein